MSNLRITLIEACALVPALEPRVPAPSYWVARRLDDIVGAVDSARVVCNQRATTRLLDVYDVMLLRLWARISADTVQPAWVPGAVLAQHRPQLREVFRRRLDRVLVLRGMRAQIVSPQEVEALKGERYALADVPHGVVEAMRAVRGRQPRIWTGCTFARVGDVDTVPSSQAALSERIA